MEKIRLIFREYLDELVNKVTWPRQSDLQSSTITVLVASLIVAILIYVTDLAFNGVLQLIYSFTQ